MNLLKKTFALLFLLFLGSSALADGMIVDRQSRLYMQDSQQAFINYENGVENLFIMVNLRDAIASGEENVWIFPVPAKPESIEINNLKGFPALYGTEIKQQAIENVLFLEGYMALAAFPPAMLYLNKKDMAVIAASNFFTLIVAGIVIALTDKKKFPVKEKEKATTAGKKLIALLAFEGIFFGFAVILFILTLTVISLTAA